jgi:hypothetical protein
MSAGCLTGYAHAEAVALLVRGYPPTDMADTPGTPDPDDTLTLHVRQDERAAEEREQERAAEAPAEARAHGRRAEKAAYLRDKLAEADRSARKD